jgi:hypothetical protein
VLCTSMQTIWSRGAIGLPSSSPGGSNTPLRSGGVPIDGLGDKPLDTGLAFRG